LTDVVNGGLESVAKRHSPRAEAVILG